MYHLSTYLDCMMIILTKALFSQCNHHHPIVASISWGRPCILVLYAGAISIESFLLELYYSPTWICLEHCCCSMTSDFAEKLSVYSCRLLFFLFPFLSFTLPIENLYIYIFNKKDYHHVRAEAWKQGYAAIPILSGFLCCSTDTFSSSSYGFISVWKYVYWRGEFWTVWSLESTSSTSPSSGSFQCKVTA